VWLDLSLLLSVVWLDININITYVLTRLKVCCMHGCSGSQRVNKTLKIVKIENNFDDIKHE